jgi:hypothetical protein
MSEHTIQQLDRRLAQLEEEVRRLKETVRKEENGKPWWEQIVGSHKGSEAFAEIVRLGREIREAERRKAGGNGDRRTKKPTSAKSGKSTRSNRR